MRAEILALLCERAKKDGGGTLDSAENLFAHHEIMAVATSEDQEFNGTAHHEKHRLMRRLFVHRSIRSKTRIAEFLPRTAHQIDLKRSSVDVRSLTYDQRFGCVKCAASGNPKTGSYPDAVQEHFRLKLKKDCRALATGSVDGFVQQPECIMDRKDPMLPKRDLVGTIGNQLRVRKPPRRQQSAEVGLRYYRCALRVRHVVR